MVYIILFEEIEEKEFDEQKQKVINKADRRLHRHKRENRFLWKSSENYGGVIDDTTLMVINKLINDNVIKNIKSAFTSGRESKVYIDDEGNPSNLLSSKSVTSEDYNEIIQQASKLYQKAELVHADLPEYNIFKCSDGRIMFFDFGSSVNTKHPNSKHFYTRDIINLNRFFEKQGIQVLNNDSAIQKIIEGKIK